jgi:hypothetical protein
LKDQEIHYQLQSNETARTTFILYTFPVFTLHQGNSKTLVNFFDFLVLLISVDNFFREAEQILQYKVSALRLSILISLVLVFSFSVLALSMNEALAVGGAAGIGGKVYTRNHMGDYRETGWANITAAGEHGVFEGQFNMGGNYYMFVPPGNYLLTAQMPGYIDQAREVTVSEGGSVSINFYMEQSGVPIPEFHEYATMLMTAVSLLLVIFIMRKRNTTNRSN